jgi:hypothetical protein
MIVMRRLGPVSLLAVVVVAVAGCADAVAGSPAATTGSPSSATEPPSAGPSAAIDPCALLTDTEIQQLGLLPSGRDTIVDARSCSWHKAGQYTIGAGIFDHVGLAQLSKVGRTITNYSVGSHDGRQVLSQEAGCGIYLQITKTSIVDIVAVDALGDTQSCQLADRYAKLIEPRLPAEQR